MTVETAHPAPAAIRAGRWVKPKSLRVATMYQKPTDRIKVFPIPDTHLNGAAVLACSIIDQQEATGELQEQLVVVRGMVAELRDVVRWMVAEVSDLLTRQDIEHQLAVAGREKPGFGPPKWFFTVEGGTTQGMLARRAKYLKAARLDLDCAWNLLSEFIESAHLDAGDDVLSEIIVPIYGGKGAQP